MVCRKQCTLAGKNLVKVAGRRQACVVLAVRANLGRLSGMSRQNHPVTTFDHHRSVTGRISRRSHERREFGVSAFGALSLAVQSNIEWSQSLVGVIVFNEPPKGPSVRNKGTR